MKTLKVKSLAAEVETGLDAIIGDLSSKQQEATRHLLSKIKELKKELRTIYSRSPKEVEREVAEVIAELQSRGGEAAWVWAVETFDSSWASAERDSSFKESLARALLDFFQPRTYKFWAKFLRTAVESNPVQPYEGSPE